MSDRSNDAHSCARATRFEAPPPPLPARPPAERDSQHTCAAVQLHTVEPTARWSYVSCIRSQPTPTSGLPPDTRLSLPHSAVLVSTQCSGGGGHPTQLSPIFHFYTGLEKKNPLNFLKKLIIVGDVRIFRVDFPVPAERFQEKCVDRSSLKSFCHAGFKKRTTELWDSTLPSVCCGDVCGE